MTSAAKPVAKGDTLYVERLYSNKGDHVTPHTVESVGRTWINLSQGLRVDKTTLLGDMLVAYLSMAEYEDMLRIKRLTRRINNKLQSYSSSNSVTAAQIDAIGIILGLNGDLAVPDQ